MQSVTTNNPYVLARSRGHRAKIDINALSSFCALNCQGYSSESKNNLLTYHYKMSDGNTVNIVYKVNGPFDPDNIMANLIHHPEPVSWSITKERTALAEQVRDWMSIFKSKKTI